MRKNPSPPPLISNGPSLIVSSVEEFSLNDFTYLFMVVDQEQGVEQKQEQFIYFAKIATSCLTKSNTNNFVKSQFVG